MFFLSPALHDIFHTPINSLFMLKLSLNTHQPSNHLFVLVTKFGTKVEHGGRSLNAVRPLGFHPQSRETLVVWYLCTYHLTHSCQILHDNSYSGEGTWNVLGVSIFTHELDQVLWTVTGLCFHPFVRSLAGLCKNYSTNLCKIWWKGGRTR